MRHLATISEGRFERNPVHVECSCLVAGDFPDEDSARRWMQGHFAKLTGIAYGEFAESAPTPSAPVPEPEPAAEGLKKNEQTEAPIQDETLGAA